ncbi:MAG TPA: hypothetical protein VFZ66_12945 [Herpetosiphonaceae bacterium]
MDAIEARMLKITLPRSTMLRNLLCCLCSLTLVLMSNAASKAATQTIQLNLLYVHGVKGGTSDRQNAQYSLDELEAAVNAEIGSRIQTYQSAHPGVTIAYRSARANLYTATPSPYHPSDSLGPLYMDDWEVGDPGCTTTKQGQPCTTAYEWRYRLAREIESKFPGDAKNVILVGHSTGGRVAMEVAANVGPDGVGTMNWGVQHKIAGVVSVQGMLDALNSSKYNVVGSASFVTTCKNGDPILGFGSSTALGNGWCEYAGYIGGFPAADWVAKNKRALMLISYASCSPSLWTGYSDGPLPYDAQGSTAATGIQMTPAPGQTWRPAHGVKYGSFCHSAITSTSDSNHAAAVSAAKTRLLNWIFDSAPRTAAQGSVTTDTLSYNTSSPVYAIGGSCGTGEIDSGVAVTGVCKHPGYFDGDDHVVAASELTIIDGASCGGSFKWTQRHDSSNRHAATLWWKTYSQPASRDLIGTLTPN